MFFPHESLRRIFLRSSQRISSYSILCPANTTGHFRMWEMHSCSTLNSPLNDLKYGKGPEFILKEICSVSYPLKMPMLLATCENRWNMKHFGLFLKLTLYSWSLCIAFFFVFHEICSGAIIYYSPQHSLNKSNQCSSLWMFEENIFQ